MSAVVATGVGAVHVAPADVVAGLWRGATGADRTGPYDFIVWNLRAPRVLEAIFVGAGLALAGAIAQAVVGNPIADPYVLGLSSGAGLGAVAVITTFGVGVAGSLSLPAAAFATALLTGLLVLLLARSGPRLDPSRLVMVGISVGSLLAGITSFLLLRSGNGDAARQVMFWLLGSLSGAQWRLVVISAPLVLLAGCFALLRAGRLNLLSLGDDSAAALGMRPARARAGFFALAAFLTGVVVAVSGTIGFVGLVMPAFARVLVGADHRRVLPVAALLGALLVLLADTAARTVLAPTELPIGILTAFVGVPVFVLAVRRQAAP
ncbi:FecCD family ABC transporter permease [Flexivirga aerilata]|uniref:FecCD family ABC transporter permease n=1 Tax=Flexivirga aerilata TaxID=1656889 RepID=UPI001FE62882|nr:iron ABC transporter permease [Flexivirga aerilata]